MRFNYGRALFFIAVCFSGAAARPGLCTSQAYLQEKLIALRTTFPTSIFQYHFIIVDVEPKLFNYDDIGFAAHVCGDNHFV